MSPTFLLVAAAMVGVPRQTPDTVHLVVVATADVQGHATAWDYVNDRAAPWGLTRAATAIDSLRRRYPDRVILLDAGGLIEGGPFATYFATVDTTAPHPVVDALNALRYDAATLGNHDFDWGLEVLAQAAGAAAYPIVSANVFRLPRDTLAYDPYTIVTRGGVRVGVTGLTTPGTMAWNGARLAGHLLVRRIAPAAAQAMRLLGAAGVDVTIVLAHSGLDAPSSYDTTGIGGENVAAALATLPVKPDLVVLGHLPGALRDSVLGGVHFVRPAAGARSLAVAHLWVVPRAGGGWRVARVAGEQIALTDVPPDSTLARRLARAREQVRTWIGLPLATVVGDWSLSSARSQSTPLTTFVGDVLRRTAGADLAVTTVFDSAAGWGPGTVRVRDVARLYPQPVTLRAVRIDGAGLLRFLEATAATLPTYPAGPAASTGTPEPLAAVGGVSYVIDVSQPAGSRIRQLTYQGRLVEGTDAFTLALGSDRLNGGSAFAALERLPVVYDRGERVMDLVANAVRDAGTLRAVDYPADTWHVIPPAAAAALRTAPPAPAPTRPSRDSLVLRVLSLGDLHGALQGTAVAGGRHLGGVAVLGAWMDTLTARCRCAAVRLDAGDAWRGGAASTLAFGQPVVAAFNQLHIDAAAVGEEDLAWSADTVRARATEARYPLVSANAVQAATDAPLPGTRPWVLLERGGVRVAVIGLTQVEPPENTLAGTGQDVRILPPAAALRRVMPDVRAARPDFVVLLADAGGRCDASGCLGALGDLARGLDSAGVDLIVAGHDSTDVNRVVNGVPIIRGRPGGADIGVVDFVRRADGGREVRSQLVAAWADSVRPDTAATALVDGVTRRLGTAPARPVAEMKFSLGLEGDEPALGNLVADAERRAARTDVAFAQRGAVRAGLVQGPANWGDLVGVLPVQSPILRFTIPGDSLQALIERVVSGNRPGAWVSGMTIHFDPRRPSGHRVRSMRLDDGRSVEHSATFTVAITAAAAREFSVGGASREPAGVSDFAAFAAYLRVVPQPVEAPAGQRMVVER